MVAVYSKSFDWRDYRRLWRNANHSNAPFFYALRREMTAPGLIYFFSISLGRVRLSPLGTSATNWPTVPAPDDR
jgi:hypothetical protein